MFSEGNQADTCSSLENIAIDFAKGLEEVCSTQRNIFVLKLTNLCLYLNLQVVVIRCKCYDLLCIKGLLIVPSELTGFQQIVGLR